MSTPFNGRESRIRPAVRHPSFEAVIGWAPIDDLAARPDDAAVLASPAKPEKKQTPTVTRFIDAIVLMALILAHSKHADQNRTLKIVERCDLNDSNTKLQDLVFALPKHDKSHADSLQSLFNQGMAILTGEQQSQVERAQALQLAIATELKRAATWGNKKGLVSKGSAYAATLIELNNFFMDDADVMTNIFHQNEVALLFKDAKLKKVSDSSPLFKSSDYSDQPLFDESYLTGSKTLKAAILFALGAQYKAEAILRQAIDVPHVKLPSKEKMAKRILDGLSPTLTEFLKRIENFPYAFSHIKLALSVTEQPNELNYAPILVENFETAHGPKPTFVMPTSPAEAQIITSERVQSLTEHVIQYLKHEKIQPAEVDEFMAAIRARREELYDHALATASGHTVDNGEPLAETSIVAAGWDEVLTSVNQTQMTATAAVDAMVMAKVEPKSPATTSTASVGTLEHPLQMPATPTAPATEVGGDSDSEEEVLYSVNPTPVKSQVASEAQASHTTLVGNELEEGQEWDDIEAAMAGVAVALEGEGEAEEFTSVAVPLVLAATDNDETGTVLSPAERRSQRKDEVSVRPPSMMVTPTKAVEKKTLFQKSLAVAQQMAKDAKDEIADALNLTISPESSEQHTDPLQTNKPTGTTSAPARAAVVKVGTSVSALRAAHEAHATTKTIVSARPVVAQQSAAPSIDNTVVSTVTATAEQLASVATTRPELPKGPPPPVPPRNQTQVVAAATTAPVTPVTSVTLPGRDHRKSVKLSAQDIEATRTPAQQKEMIARASTTEPPKRGEGGVNIPQGPQATFGFDDVFPVETQRVAAYRKSQQLTGNGISMWEASPSQVQPPSPYKPSDEALSKKAAQKRESLIQERKLNGGLLAEFAKADGKFALIQARARARAEDPNASETFVKPEAATPVVVTAPAADFNTNLLAAFASKDGKFAAIREKARVRAENPTAAETLPKAPAADGGNNPQSIASMAAAMAASRVQSKFK